MMNINCLQGIACPQCGNAHRIYIETSTLAVVTDDGAETFGDMHWNGDSYAECPECQYSDKLEAFSVDPDSTTSTLTTKE